MKKFSLSGNVKSVVYIVIKDLKSLKILGCVLKRTTPYRTKSIYKTAALRSNSEKNGKNKRMK